MRYLIFSLIFCSVCQGQVWLFPCAISSIAEQYRVLGENRVKESIARRIDSETRSNEIKTREERIFSRWRIQDEYNKRKPSFDYTDFRELRINNAKRRHELLLEEKKLMASGVLPAKKETMIVWGGVIFNSYQSFRDSTEYQEMIKQRDLRLRMEELDLNHQREQYRSLVSSAHSRTKDFIELKWKNNVKVLENDVINSGWYRVFVLNQSLTVEDRKKLLDK